MQLRKGQQLLLKEQGPLLLIQFPSGSAWQRHWMVWPHRALREATLRGRGVSEAMEARLLAEWLVASRRLSEQREMQISVLSLRSAMHPSLSNDAFGRQSPWIAPMAHVRAFGRVVMSDIRPNSQEHLNTLKSLTFSPQPSAFNQRLSIARHSVVWEQRSERLCPRSLICRHWSRSFAA